MKNLSEQNDANKAAAGKRAAILQVIFNNKELQPITISGSGVQHLRGRDWIEPCSSGSNGCVGMAVSG